MLGATAALLFSVRLLGRTLRKRRVTKSRIEKVDLRSSTSGRHLNGQELVVRADDTVLTLCRNLDAESLRWLHTALLDMATH